MQQLWRAADGGTHDHPERLVPEAYPEHRLGPLAAGLDHRHADASFLGRARAWRHEDPVEVGPVGLKDSRISIDDDQNIDVRV